MAAFQDFKDFTAALQSIAAIIVYLVGGLWVWRRFFRENQDRSHIQSGAEIKVIGRQDDCWVLELVGILENKGKVQHKITEFMFNLDALFDSDTVETNAQWGGQVYFPHSIIQEGSMLPARYNYFFIDPGITARYPFIAKAPSEATFINFHCWFKYTDRKRSGHTAEKTIRLPSDINPGNRQQTDRMRIQ